jgi:hypothetical protein
LSTALGAAPPAFLHEAFLYRSEDEFLAGVGGFVGEGLAAGDVTVVAEPAGRLALLRDALGPGAGPPSSTSATCTSCCSTPPSTRTRLAADVPLRHRTAARTGPGPRCTPTRSGPRTATPDPLAGRLRPPPGQEGGAGLYLVNQLADLTRLRSGPAGTTVRVTTWR